MATTPVAPKDASVTPPPHIVGINLTRAARNDRDRWVASLPPHVSTARLAALLGISQRSVTKAYPLRSSGKIPAAVMPPTADVSLPSVPGVEITRARPETDPRAGIVTPARKHLTIEERIEVIRQMCIKARAAA